MLINQSINQLINQSGLGPANPRNTPLHNSTLDLQATRIRVAT